MIFPALSLLGFGAAGAILLRYGFQAFLAPSDLWLLGCILLGVGFRQLGQARRALRDGWFDSGGARFSRADGRRDYALHVGMMILPAVILVGLGTYLIVLPWPDM